VMLPAIDVGLVSVHAIRGGKDTINEEKDCLDDEGCDDCHPGGPPDPFHGHAILLAPLLVKEDNVEDDDGGGAEVDHDELEERHDLAEAGCRVNPSAAVEHLKIFD